MGLEGCELENSSRKCINLLRAIVKTTGNFTIQLKAYDDLNYNKKEEAASSGEDEE